MEIYLGNINDEIHFYKKLLNINNNINFTIICNEYPLKLKKYGNAKIIYQKNINNTDNINYEFEDEEESDENEDNEDNEDNEYSEENNLIYNKLIDEDDDIVVNEVKIKNKKFKKIENVNDEIICIEEELDEYDIYRNERNFSKKEKLEYIKNNKIIFFKTDIISYVNHFKMIEKSLSILNPNLNIDKLKFNLISNEPNDNIIQQFKNLNNVLLIFTSGNIRCIYKKNSKDTYLNTFILHINRYYSYLYYTINKKNFVLSSGYGNKEVFTTKYSEFFEEYNESHYKKVELFQIKKI